jgi:large subunit ribosomal protein L30
VGNTIKVKMVKSEIGRPEKQRKILRGLGLNKLNNTVTLSDTPQIRGMINKVIHLVSVEESKE